MIGFVLAAGFGTRLRPLTDHVAKALVPVAGKPALERQLRRLSSAGITRIGVNLHYLPEQIRAFQQTSPVTFQAFHEQDRIRGTGGGLYFAREFLDSEETFMVCNADIVSDADVEALAARFMTMDCSCMLVGAPRRESATVYFDPRTLEYRGAHTETGLPAGAEPSEFIGMAFYRRDFLRLLRESDFSVVPVWRRAQQAGHSVKVLTVDGMYWKDLGTPALLAQVHFDILDGAFEAGPLTPGMVIDKTRKIAHSGGLGASEISGLAAHSWVEPRAVPEGACFARAVVFADADLRAGQRYEKVLLTRWGGMSIE